MSSAGSRATTASFSRWPRLVPAARFRPGPPPSATTLTASKAAKKGCHTRYAGRSARTGTLRVTGGATGLLQARLKSRGDWDLAVFDARTKRYVAGSAAFGGRELAEGFVTKGQRLIVQGCRFAGPREPCARGRVRPRGARAARGRTQVVEVDHAHPRGQEPASGPRTGSDRERRRRLDRRRAGRRRGRAQAPRGEASLQGEDRRPRRPDTRQPARRPALPDPDRRSGRQPVCRAAGPPTATSPTTSWS